MFKEDLGFNPFDKRGNNNSKQASSLRKKFLDSFFAKHTFAYNANPTKKISNMNHTFDLSTAIENNKSNNSDVYFYVNGVRKINDIRQFVCCFCDIDVGRGSDGKYFKPSIVIGKKKNIIKKINEFPVKPSWVVDTRNGYQCYWIFDNKSKKYIGNNKTLWNGLQKKLVNYFGADARAIKPNQILRVPYTWWNKSWEKKAPYFTSIVSGSLGKPIDVILLKTALDGQSTIVKVNPIKCSDTWYKKASENNNKYFAPLNKKGDNRPLALSYLNLSKNQKDLSINDESQILLKTVIDFLYQVSTPLYYSKNYFLSNTAKDLAAKISDCFCIG